MAKQRWIGSFRVVVLASVAMAPVLFATAARAELAVTTDPVAPVLTDAFDLSVLREFGDAGYGLLDQSITVDGDQIDVDVVIQDLHTQPGVVFAQVVKASGALFEDVGPLATGTYRVNARMWLASWPDHGPGTLYDTGSLTLHALHAASAPEPSTAVLMAVGAGILGAVALRRKLGQLAA